MNIVGSMTPWGEFGDIGEGVFLDFSVDASGFTDEPSGIGIPVGDSRYIHGYYIMILSSIIYEKYREYAHKSAIKSKTFKVMTWVYLFETQSPKKHAENREIPHKKPEKEAK